MACYRFGFRDDAGAVKGDNCVLIQSDGVQKPPTSYEGYHYYSTVEGKFIMNLIY